MGVGLLCAVAAIAAPGAGAAQDTLSLHQAIDTALAQNALVAAGVQRVHAAEGAKTQAGLAPNPRFIFQHENIRLWGSPLYGYWQDTDTYAYVSQVIETANKRGHRVETASAGLNGAKAEQDVLKFQISARVAAAYWAAAGADRMRRLLRQQEQNIMQTLSYTEVRVKEGAAAGVDLMRMRLEQQRVSALLSTAEADAVRTRAMLFEAMGIPARDDVTLSEDLESIRVPVVPDTAQVLEQRPEVRALRRAADTAKANVKLQRAVATPDVEVLGGYKRTAGVDTLIGGVQFNLPWRNRNQGNIASAEAEVRGAEENLRAMTVQVETEVSAAVADYNVKRALVTEAFPEMRRNAAESARIVTAAWKEGGADILRWLDAERVRIDVELQYARALVDFQQSALQLTIATGANP